MLDILTKGIAKVFGTKSERDLKQVRPYVDLINNEFAKLKSISDDELRQKTAGFKSTISTYLAEIDKKIEELHGQIAGNPELELNAKEEIFKKIDQLGKDRNAKLEEVLLQLLPQAFAVVRETARRLKENHRLTVKVTPHDIEIASRRDGVKIEGEQAVWSNTWMAAGSPVTWDMMHYDVQLIGGIVLHQGKIAEMATGEGKTLVATLPAYLNALAGRGVHIVTVNDYLAKRDSEWMGPLFEFHGLKVDCIDKHQPNTTARRNAYMADITYGTNNEFGFDYLRDNMSRTVEELVQRKHHYAMVDEVDSVLIDDARTPLIISGPVPSGGDEEEVYRMLRPRINKVVEEQRKLINNYLTEAKKKLNDGNEEEGGLALFRAYRGLPKLKPLIKFLSEPGIRAKMQKVENYYLQDNSKLMPEADKPLFFTIDEKQNSVELTERGIDMITMEGEDRNFFILPDIGTEIAEIEREAGLSEEDKLARKDKLIAEYSEKTQRIHAVNQLLKAYTIFEKDVDYIIQDGKVKIVDEQTGRVMEGRRYSDGLHQALEAKENVKVEEATQTYATITLQNYFRMYHKLAGMTGTAETEASEFMEIYKLDVVVIPTNRVIQRDDREDKVYKTVRSKFNAVVEEVQQLTAAGRPVLVGTTSVEISELLSRMLQLRKIPHQVLNAKQHAREAEVVAEAGKPGTVTIATNMAGRGTDIKLTPEAKAAGGLAIIGTERHESRRVDRQLRGRSGRQGDPGTSQFFVSLEDNLMRIFGSDRITRVMDKIGLEEDEVIQHSMITKSIERAQKKVEENNFSIRKRLLEYDDVMNAQREVIYKLRRNALDGERLQLDIMTMFYETASDIVEANRGDYESFKLAAFTAFGVNTTIPREMVEGKSSDEPIQKLYEEVYGKYLQKNKQLAEMAFGTLTQLKQTHPQYRDIMVEFTDGLRRTGIICNLDKAIESKGREIIKVLEQSVTLSFIDQEWKEHLRDMDDLRQQVQFATLEQKDPLLIYKFESFQLFKALIQLLHQQITSFLAKAVVYQEQQQPVAPAPRQTAPNRSQKLIERKEESHSVLKTESDNKITQRSSGRQNVEVTRPVTSEKLPGRNDKVTVRYADGTIKKDVKFKTVEQDLRENRCVLI